MIISEPGLAKPNVPTWGVVCTADEPLPLLYAFALHHLHLGASEVNIYLDNPRPGHREALEGLTGVRVVSCDTEHWQGKRPTAIESRQSFNAYKAYTRATTDWLCHIDSDEFVTMQGDQKVADILSMQEDATSCLVMPVHERIYMAEQPVQDLFSGSAVSQYRFLSLANPTPALKLRQKFTNRGLLGHMLGKSFVRTNRQLIIGIHRPRPNKDHPHRNLGREAVMLKRVQSLYITHFDGLTPFHWFAKLWRMASFMKEAHFQRQGAGRQALIQTVRKTLPETGPVQTLARRLRHLDQDSVSVLQQAGAFHPLRPSPSALVIKRGLLSEAGYHPDSFDTEMVNMYPQLQDLYHLWSVNAATDPVMPSSDQRG